MFFQKITLSLAFAGLATQGIIPAVDVSHIAITKPAPQSKAKVRDVVPFNPKALVHKYDQNGNYYAYYAKKAFRASPNFLTYGYVMNISRTWVPILLQSYEKGFGKLSSLLGAIYQKQATPGPYNPYINSWCFSKYILADTTNDEGHAILNSFNRGIRSVIVSIVNETIQSRSNLYFLFFIANNQDTSRVLGRVEIINPAIGADYYTPWYPNF